MEQSNHIPNGLLHAAGIGCAGANSHFPTSFSRLRARAESSRVSVRFVPQHGFVYWLSDSVDGERSGCSTPRDRRRTAVQGSLTVSLLLPTKAPRP